MTYLIHMWPLRFNNRFIDVLPCDPEVSLRSRQVLEAWSGVAPTRCLCRVCWRIHLKWQRY